MDLELIKEILTTKYEYWIVAEKTDYVEGSGFKRGEDNILFIAIPKEVRRGLKYEEITLKDIETLYNSYLDQNIYLYPDYSPFQDYVPFKKVYKGFPKRTLKNFC
ncbi:MAG: hypothetical protein GYA51_10435 [Candidatus Methanofastidiosa archaeon]|nr:hypothetical protein [Candidatus Methanofastidiosa archaeon]